MKWMKTTVALLALACAGQAHAAINLVNNGSFEIVPVGGLVPFGACGAGCTYSAGPIPFWAGGNAFHGAGQVLGGGNGTFLNYVPDGNTFAYTNAVPLTQTLGAVVVAGATYNFSVDIGFAKAANIYGLAVFNIAGHAITATGTAPTRGNWSTYTASYVATAADAGGSMFVSLQTVGVPGIQGDFDNVIVTQSLPGGGGVPEPSTWALMLTGFAFTGAAIRRRRSGEAAVQLTHS